MNKVFFDELSNMNLTDLELIYRDQRELYSDEDFDLIDDIYHRRKDAETTEYSNWQFSLSVFCVMALLSPAAGVAAGIMMLIRGKRHEKWKEAARRTLAAAFISLIILIFLRTGGFRIGMF